MMNIDGIHAPVCLPCVFRDRIPDNCALQRAEGVRAAGGQRSWIPLNLQVTNLRANIACEMPQTANE